MEKSAFGISFRGETRLFSVRGAPASGAILTEECDGFDLGAQV